MNVLISGGAKNGKSYYAQKIARQMAEAGPICGGQTVLPLYYIATMIPCDEEDRARIRRHVAERAGWGFETLEQGTDLTALLQADYPNPPDPKGVFLLDSVTALLSNEMFRPDHSVDHGAAQRVAKDCTAFAKATGNTIFVSDYIYGDANRYDELTEEYRQDLAFLDLQLAAVCERVIEVSAGIVEDWKR